MRHRGALLAGVTCGLLASGASGAAAAGLAPQTVTNPVTIAPGSNALGTMTFNTSIDAASAVGTARSASLRLSNGRTYRIQTCVWAKEPAQAPQSQCESEVVTINFLQTLTGIPAPTAQLAIVRPAAGQPAATIAGTVLIDVRDDSGSWVNDASSWPQAGMPAAGVAVPAVDQTSGAVLGPQGNLLPGLRPGGINTGAQDSICRGTETSATAPAQGSTDALGALPAPYEVQEPLGKYSGRRTHGVMIILHGGTWQMHGSGELEYTRSEADRWRARGWRTVMGDYRACGDSIDDVTTLFDRVRQVYGDARPICVSGQSSGGHLALLLAARRPEVACVISQAGPADLTALASQAATKRDGTPSALIPLQLSNVMISAFGADRQTQVSPTKLGVSGRVLFAIAASDPGIPWAQAADFAAAQKARNASAYVDTMRLADGDMRWVHTDVSGAALARFHQREKLLTDPLIKGGLIVAPAVQLRGLRRRGVSAAYTCPGACRIKAALTLDRRTARGLRLPTGIGSASARRATFGTSGIVVRLSATARRRMRSRTVLHLVVSMQANSDTKRFSEIVRVR